MIEEEEALARVLEATPLGPLKSTPIVEACDRFARRSVHAQVAIPAFNNSSVDGYALGPGSLAAGASYRVVGEQAAGLDQEWALKLGEAVRIFTGAPLPHGTQAVLMVEESRFDPEQGSVHLMGQVERGENVRPRGADLCSGQKILSEGDLLTVQRLALLASQGFAEISVSARPRVTIINTGDELVSAGRELRRGEIYESNGVMLELLARQAGAEHVRRIHVRDEPEALAEAVSEAREGSDYLIFSGGVSVGERDYVKSVLSNLGCQTHFWRINLKPGKPTYFGTLDQTLVFGLPGNPVACFVTFLLFCHRSILKWMGALDPSQFGSTEVKLLAPLRNDGDRPHYIRGILTSAGFEPVRLQESHGLASLSHANALLRLPVATTLPLGETVRAIPIQSRSLP